MTVRLSHARVEKVVQACEKLLSNSHPTILHLAEVIGLIYGLQLPRRGTWPITLP